MYYPTALRFSSVTHLMRPHPSKWSDALHHTKWPPPSLPSSNHQCPFQNPHHDLINETVTSISVKMLLLSGRGGLRALLLLAACLLAGSRLVTGSGVEIYTTPGCRYCQKAKGFLTARGVPVFEIDVSMVRGRGGVGGMGGGVWCGWC